MFEFLCQKLLYPITISQQTRSLYYTLLDKAFVYKKSPPKNNPGSAPAL